MLTTDNILGTTDTILDITDTTETIANHQPARPRR
jgi:hypothetical protein